MGQQTQPQPDPTSHMISNRVGGDSLSLPELPAGSSPELREAHQEFIASAGGRQRVEHLYTRLMELVESGCAPDLLAPSAPDDDRDITLLMILCSQQDDSHPGSRFGMGGARRDLPQTEAHTRALLHILAVILVTLSTKTTPILFTRNHQEASALDLTALSNKAEVVRYLALLYQPLGRDVNETNSAGHSVLHLLARKGDAAADALEALLGIRQVRLDVVNSGAKTPLDVANYCTQSYPDVSYTQVLSLFHQTISEQLLELMAATPARNQF